MDLFFKSTFAITAIVASFGLAAAEEETKTLELQWKNVAAAQQTFDSDQPQNAVLKPKQIEFSPLIAKRDDQGRLTISHTKPITLKAATLKAAESRQAAEKPE